MQQWIGLIGSFLLGSIPTAHIILKIRQKRDSGKMGNGNAVTMNVRDELGYGAAGLAQGINVFIGAYAVLICLLLRANPYLGLLLAVAGNIYPPWPVVRGGRGLSTALGGLIALGDFPAPLVFGLVWLPFYRFVFRQDKERANMAGAIATIVYALSNVPNWAMALMSLLVIGKQYQVLQAGTKQDINHLDNLD